jgi:hypothetical protein
MSRPRSALLAAVLAATVFAGTPTVGASAAPRSPSAPPASPGRLASAPPVVEDATASPLDEGQAIAPGRPVELTPETGDRRLGAAAVAAPPLTFTFKATPYDAQIPPRNRYPYGRDTGIALVDTDTHDKSGVRMKLVSGKLYDHPVGQARYGIDNLESYRATNDVRYLNRAKLQAARLMKNAKKVGNAWYLPYPFNFKLHNQSSYTQKAPWYSAMAQGQGVTLFVRLWEITQEQQYRNAADGIFNSFLTVRNAKTPWVVWVDASKRLWLEEYAGPHPDRTINGQLFAVWGLWDYWRLTQDSRAKLLYQGGLTTVVDYYSVWRNKNWVAYYCLAHQHLPQALDQKYHQIVLQQLIHSYTISHDVRLLRLSETLVRDFPRPEVVGTVTFAAGSYTAAKFTSTGKVASRKVVTLSKNSSAPTDRRARIQGQLGYWMQITAGAFKGYYVKERSGLTYLRGRSLVYSYVPPRPVSIAPGRTYTGYTFDGAGKVLGTVTATPEEVTAFGATSTALWNGAEYMLAADGPLAGAWVPTSLLTT